MGVRLFVTGRPDPLVAELIDGLVRVHEIEKLWFLIPRSDVSLAITYLPKIPPLNLIIGDFGNPHLGLQSPLEVWEEATHFVHLYECRSFNGPFPYFFMANIEAVRNALAFISRMSSLKQAIFLSTAFVAGKGKGVVEEAVTEHENDFRNHYERTKYFAEIELSKRMHILPITILRPSFVIFCHEHSRWVGYAHHLRRYVRFSSPFVGPYYIGEGKGSMNFVDFDTFQYAFIRLFDNDSAIGKVFNIVGQTLPSDEVLDTFASALGKKISGRVSVKTATTLSLISGSFLGIPRGMIGYFSEGPDYQVDNMRSLGVPISDSEHLLKKLSRIALRECNFEQEFPTLI